MQLVYNFIGGVTMDNRVLFGVMCIIFNSIGVPCFMQGRIKQGILRIVLGFITFGVIEVINCVFGIILGIFRASIYAIILSGIYPLVANIFSNDPAVINAVSDTYVLNFFIENNLIALLLKSIF